jgi:uncharacterized protein (DUF305 family)
MQHQHRSRTARTLLAAGLALVLAACGGGDDPTVGSGGDAPAVVDGISTEFNDADVAFITDMVPHHEGALEMAQLADSRAESAQVKDLASRLVAAQDPEIERMQAMAEAWDVELSDGGGMAGMDHGGGDMEMSDDVDALTPLSGAAFDREFLTRMIAHHESAVEMSETELADGENPQAKELAQEIIDAQRAEIEEMRGLLAG